MTTINVEQTMELENLYLVAIPAITDSIIMDSFGREFSMETEGVCKFEERLDTYTVSKYLLEETY